MNSTSLGPTIIVPYSIVLVLIFVAAIILLFCGLKKTGCCYLYLNTFLLKIYKYCCCCSRNYNENIEGKGSELQDLIEEL